MRSASGAEFHSVTDATTLIPRPFIQGCFSANAHTVPESSDRAPRRHSDFEKQFAGLAGSYGGTNTSMLLDYRGPTMSITVMEQGSPLQDLLSSLCPGRDSKASACISRLGCVRTCSDTHNTHGLPPGWINDVRSSLISSPGHLLLSPSLFPFPSPSSETKHPAHARILLGRGSC